MPESEILRMRVNDLSHRIALNPGDTELYFQRALALAKMGETKLAVEDCSNIIARDPWHHLAWVNRGESYLQQGDYRHAIDDFDRALALRPADALTLNDRGAAWRALGQPQQALSDFSGATDLDPALLGPRINAAQVLMELGRYDEVVTTCTEGLEIAPSSALYGLRAAAYERLGDRSEAAAEVARELAASRAHDPLGGSVPIEGSTTDTTSRRGASVYDGRVGFEPVYTDELLTAISRSAPPFERRDDLKPPPTVPFRDAVECIRLNDLEKAARELFEFSFPAFFDDASTPPVRAVESQLRNLAVEAPFNYRRYAGDRSLPRGRYFAVCRPGSTSGDQTLAREIAAYTEFSRTGEIEVVDLSDPAAERTSPDVSIGGW